jgi:uncharacterized protein (TIGR04141 family)
LINNLDQRLLDKLRTRDLDSIDLAPPEIVDWDTVTFRYSIKSEEDFPTPDISDYLNILEEQEKLSDLSTKHLRTIHKVETRDDAGNIVSHWSVFKCITGELKIGDTTYLISDGDFFEVATGYINELDTFIARLAECNKPLPDSQGDKKEGEYNEIAAGSTANYLLLDKEVVRTSNHTSPIEICDILTKDGYFIHVKRKLGSSSLSHLFAQGYVSADLFLMSEEYRKAVVKKVKSIEKQLGLSRRKFMTKATKQITPSDYEIVYAIVAKWRGRSLVEALPFFSKVNLRRCTEDLHRMGYRVSIKRVDVV